MTGDDPLCIFLTPSLFWASRRGAGCSETFCNREEELTLSDGMLCLSESENKYSWERFFYIPSHSRSATNSQVVTWRHDCRVLIWKCNCGSGSAACCRWLCVCAGGYCSWQQSREWGQGWRLQSAVPNRPARGTRLQPHSQVLEKLR